MSPTPRRRAAIALTGLFALYTGFILACAEPTFSGDEPRYARFAAFALRRPRIRRLCLSHLLALALCAPYLAYTQRLTGRVFYFSTSGGGSAYWMAAPHEEELGDWQANTYRDFKSRIWDRPDCAERMRQRHEAFFRSLTNLPEHEIDARLRAQGVRNAIAHPAKYVRNWAHNLSRMLFNYPFSCAAQTPRTLLYLLPDIPLAFLLGLAGWLTLSRRVALPQEMIPALVFAAFALGGTSLLGADHRRFAPLVPALVIWIAIALDRWLPPRPAAGAADGGAARPLDPPAVAARWRCFMERKVINPWKWQDQFAFVQANEIHGGERVLYCAGQASVDAEGRAVHAGTGEPRSPRRLTILRRFYGRPASASRTWSASITTRRTSTSCFRIGRSNASAARRPTGESP